MQSLTQTQTQSQNHYFHLLNMGNEGIIFCLQTLFLARSHEKTACPQSWDIFHINNNKYTKSQTLTLNKYVKGWENEVCRSNCTKNTKSENEFMGKNNE